MPTSQNRSRPARLTRGRIVTAALEYIDTHGAQQLTMRKLGAQLNVEAMAIYRHLSGREELLEAVVQKVLAGVIDGEDAELANSWQGFLQDLAHRIRSAALEHPHVFPLVATRHPAAPWIRPPLRNLEVVEHFLSRLTGLGFSGTQAVHAYQSFSSFLLGHLLLEVLEDDAKMAHPDVPLNEGDSDVETPDEEEDLSDYPTISELSDLLSAESSHEQFEIGLETLIDRLELSLSQ